MWKIENEKWSNSCNNCCVVCIVKESKTCGDNSCLDFSGANAIESRDCDYCNMDIYYDKKKFK